MAYQDRAQVWEKALREVGYQNLMGMPAGVFQSLVFAHPFSKYMQ
jgi:hypothetical protein